MHETPQDLEALQALLDASHAAANPHLRSIWADERRVAAADLPARLAGVQVTHLATVTARGEPRVAPVDGIFFRGALHVGTAPEAMRARHLRARPQVSASIADGEDFAVVIHGRAHELDMDAPAQDALRAHYTDIYGAGWEAFRQGNPYWRIEAVRMFTFGGMGQTVPA
jgi:nitroimidazol reductase NimA-like FMN-containing flavoprotein (pyridoxamine 5'-phosphate oxidase superfamily)